MRKVIQIAVEGANEETCSCLYALADDGTMWMKNKIGYRHDPDNFEQPWQQIQNIPQELKYAAFKLKKESLCQPPH